jgi:hypothetical protein
VIGFLDSLKIVTEASLIGAPLSPVFAGSLGLSIVGATDRRQDKVSTAIADGAVEHAKAANDRVGELTGRAGKPLGQRKMSSIVELNPARRQEVLASLRADMRRKLDVLGSANEAYFGQLGELQRHLRNCKKVLKALPSSDLRLGLENAIEEGEMNLLALKAQCERHRSLAEAAMAQYLEQSGDLERKSPDDRASDPSNESRSARPSGDDGDRKSKAKHRGWTAEAGINS